MWETDVLPSDWNHSSEWKPNLCIRAVRGPAKLLSTWAHSSLLPCSFIWSVSLVTAFQNPRSNCSMLSQGPERDTGDKMATSEGGYVFSGSASSKCPCDQIWICSDQGGGVGLELIATPHLLATSLNLAIMQMDCRAIPSIHSARMGDPSFPRVLVLGRERRPRARVSATGQKGLLQARIVAGGLACVLACIPWCLGVVARVWDSRPVHLAFLHA